MTDQPAKMGRPPVPSEEKREHPAKAMLTEKELRAVQDAAERANLPLSTWVRATLLFAAEKTSPKRGKRAPGRK